MSSDSRYPKWKNQQTPARWCIKQCERWEKTNYKKQFRRWLQDPSFEIIEQRHATSAKWEWN